MTIILQISDPHFGTEQPPVVEALSALARELEPDLLIVSGDVTQRARAAQFAAAAAFVRRLAAPHTLAIPGNHDIPLYDLIARFADPYGGYRRAFGENLEPTYTAPDCLVLAVKTTRRYRHVDGEISAAQRARVAEQLRQARPEQLRVVVLHQPVAVPRASEGHNVARGSAAAVREWASAGADVIMAGHIHLPFVLPLHELYPGLPRHVWAINAGTAVSSRVRYDAGNSVNVLRRVAAEPNGWLVEHWTFSRERARFLRAAQFGLG